MHLIKALSTLCLLLSTPLSLAAPAPSSEHSNYQASDDTAVTLVLDGPVVQADNLSLITTEASPDGIPIVLIPTIASLVGKVLDLLRGFIDQHKRQEEFVKSTVTELRNQYPSMNVIVYHNQDSRRNFNDEYHWHQEVGIALGFTKGYEIFVFRSGTFDRAGDGGFINWGFSGSYRQDGTHVEFYEIR
ncbi:hypothetical protein OQA88_7429 [Cercophora sp. LCS_1]